MNNRGVYFAESTINMDLNSVCAGPIEESLVSPSSVPLTLQLMPPMNYLDHYSDYLLNVQITTFTCGSKSIGIAMSHLLVDAEAVFQLLSNWAKLNSGQSASIHKPFLDRSVQVTTSQEIANLDPNYIPEGYILNPVSASENTTTSNNRSDAPAAPVKPPVCMTKFFRFPNQVLLEMKKDWTVKDSTVDKILSETAEVHKAITQMESSKFNKQLAWVQSKEDRSRIQPSFKIFLDNDLAITSWTKQGIYKVDFGCGSCQGNDSWSCCRWIRNYFQY